MLHKIGGPQTTKKAFSRFFGRVALIFSSFTNPVIPFHPSLIEWSIEKKHLNLEFCF